MARRFIGNVKGVGVENVIREYYSSTSASDVIGGSWVSTVPTLDTSHYLWTRLKITLTDNTVLALDPLREGMFGEEIKNLEDAMRSIREQHSADKKQLQEEIKAVVVTPLTDEEIRAICV